MQKRHRRRLLISSEIICNIFEICDVDIVTKKRMPVSEKDRAIRSAPNKTGQKSGSLYWANINNGHDICFINRVKKTEAEDNSA